MATPIRRSSRLQRLSLSRGEENQEAPIIITKNKSVRKPKKVLTNVVNTISEVRLNNFKISESPVSCGLTLQTRGHSIIFCISWAADPCRSMTMWFQWMMVPSC